MIKITKLLGYQNDIGLKAHLFRTKTLLNLLSKFKRMSTNEKKSFKNLFRGLYQKGVFVDINKVSTKFKKTEVCSEFIPVDGPAEKEQIIKVKERLPKFCS